MAKVTVHNFVVPDIIEGDYVPAKGKATTEMIASFHGKVVAHTAEVIDESLLNATGRYHQPKDQPNRKG